MENEMEEVIEEVMDCTIVKTMFNKVKNNECSFDEFFKWYGEFILDNYNNGVKNGCCCKSMPF